MLFQGLKSVFFFECVQWCLISHESDFIYIYYNISYTYKCIIVLNIFNSLILLSDLFMTSCTIFLLFPDLDHIWAYSMRHFIHLYYIYGMSIIVEYFFVACIHHIPLMKSLYFLVKCLKIQLMGIRLSHIIIFLSSPKK